MQPNRDPLKRIHANPEAAVKAIGSALQDGIPERKLTDGEAWMPKRPDGATIVPSKRRMVSGAGWLVS